ncbi:ribonuclease III [bacterium]|nr:ribonuclease III [bacterium]
MKLLFERWELYFLIKKHLGIYPNSLSPYRLSFIHRSSMLKDENGDAINNERLEFLGDAILGSIVAEELYLQFPHLNEGALTKTRSKVVNRSALNRIALDMRLDKIVKYQSQIHASKTHILGDALEAIIGAVFVDKGYSKCKSFVLHKVIFPHVQLQELLHKESNFKSLLIEYAQKNKVLIEYFTRELDELKDNAIQFFSKVVVNDEELGVGIGKSKKKAQQRAAAQAWEKLHLYSSQANTAVEED